MRSWLVAPADKENALAAVASAGADVVVVDLGRALGGPAQAAARSAARTWIDAQRQQVLAQRHFARWVRIAGPKSPHWREDLEAVVAGQPEGILLADVDDPEEVKQLAAVLYEFEERHGVPQGQTAIVPQLGSSARAVAAIARFGADLHQRVSGLTWDAAALARSLGARRTRNASGAWSDVMAHVRAQVLIAAHAQGLEALESPCREARETDAATRTAQAARADGFTGMLAVHPSQVRPINAAFEPTPSELAEAEDIVASFASNPGQHSLAIGGRRIGQAQLVRAQQLVAAS